MRVTDDSAGLGRDRAKLHSAQMRARFRRFVVVPILWWAKDAEQSDPREQTAWGYGKARSIAAAKDGRAFGLVATVTTCAMPTGVGFATTHLPLGAQTVLIVLAAAVGYLLVPTAWAVCNTLLAPYRQRDEARAQLRELRSDSPTLAKEFSDWVTAKRAALPQFGMRQQAGLFAWGGMSDDTNAQIRRDNEQRRDEIARVQAKARGEYHERFRARLVGVLGDTPQAQEPQTIADLEKLSVQLARAMGTPPPAKAVLRALSRDGHSLRNEIPIEPTVERRKALEPRVDSFRERAVEELSECAPEFVSELEKIPIYHPADLDAIPLTGDPAPLRSCVQDLLKVIDSAIKVA